jgi:polyisoprenoid-binding protein YceI
MNRRLSPLALLVLVLSPLLAVAGALPAAAEQVVVQLDPEATEVSFVLGATGHDVHGTFGFDEGTIRFDPGTGEASGELVVDAADAETGNGSRDKTMHKKVLESDRFPRIVFHVEQVEGALPEQGHGTLQLHGTMEIHGTEHPMTMPAELDRQGETVHATTHFDVPFVDWGMEDPSILFLRVEKSVAVTVETEGHLGGASSRAMDATEAGQGGR